MNERLILQLISLFSEIPGKKVFQKLCYFLQEAEGARLGARFRMKHYGPYSEALDECLQDLADRELVRVSGSSDEGFSISLGERAPTELTELDERDKVALKQLSEKLSDRVSRRNGLTLELMATVHYLARGQSYSGTSSDRDDLEKQVRAWKGPKFDGPFIQRQITSLEELGYLVPSET